MSKNRDLGNYGSAALLDAHSEVVANTVVQRTANGDINANNVNASTITGTLSGSATSLATARTITLGGDLSGSASFDGTANVTITATVADDSHNHIIGNVDGLQDALDLKAPLASPTLTGTPAAPTANAGTNTTQIATTAFVQTAVAGIVDTAPETLDTLNELAAALGDDPNFATTVSNSIGGKAPLTGEGTSGTWGISITGNANTVNNGVYTSGDQTIAGVKTFSNNAVFDGSVGIGTSTILNSNTDVLTVGKASSSFDSAIVIRQFNNGTASALRLIANNDTGASYNNISSSTFEGTQHWRLGGAAGSAGSLPIFTSGTEKIRIANTGNVGIGTTSPEYKLHIEAGGDHIKMSRSGVGEFKMGVASGRNLVFEDGTASAERMRISNTGNVGIGTSSPSDGKLHVSGANYNQQLVIERTDTSSKFGLAGTANGGFQIYDVAAGDLTRFVIDNSGRVGIGGTPAAKLDVFDTTGSLSSTKDLSGRFYRFDGTYNPRLEIRHSTSGTDIHHTYSASASNLTFSVGNLERVRIDGNGFVGIGTSSPTAKLQVNGVAKIGTADGANPVVLGTHLDTFSTNFPTISTNNHADLAIGVNISIKSDHALDTTNNHSAIRGSGIVFGGNGYDLGTNSIGFFTNPPTTATAGTSIPPSAAKMVIDNAGNVGVGTSSPAQKFSVDGGSIKLNHGNASTACYLWLNKKEGFDGGILLQRDNGFDWQIANLSTTGNLGFYSYGAGSQVVLIERATGHVGIGTTSPSARLNIVGTGTANYPTLALDVVSSASFVHAQETFASNITSSQAVVNIIGREGSTKNSGYIGYLYGSAGSNDNKLTFGHWGADHLMVLDGAGNVGIGTTSPGAYKLYVAGDQYISGTLTEASSQALKENIAPISNALNLVSRLTGVTYDRIDGSDYNRAGLIAEQVQDIIPNVVQKDEEGNPMGIKYTNIIAYLIESIKELKEEIDVLKGK